MHGEKILKDERLVLPLKSRKAPYILDPEKFQQVEEYYPADHDEDQQSIVTRNPFPDKSFSDEINTREKTTNLLTAQTTVAKDVNQSESPNKDKMKLYGSPSRNRLVAPAHTNRSIESSPFSSPPASSAHETPQHKKSTYGTDSQPETLHHPGDERLRTKETERQIIERELQRQRTMAITGHKSKTGLGSQTHPVRPTENVRIKKEISKKMSVHDEPESDNSAGVPPLLPERRTVIIQRKRVHSVLRETQAQKQENQDISGNNDCSSPIKNSEEYSKQSDSEGVKIENWNSANKSKDPIFGGKGIAGSAGPQVRDSALIHTNLKSKKKSMESKDMD